MLRRILRFCWGGFFFELWRWWCMRWGFQAGAVVHAETESGWWIAGVQSGQGDHQAHPVGPSPADESYYIFVFTDAIRFARVITLVGSEANVPAFRCPLSRGQNVSWRSSKTCVDPSGLLHGLNHLLRGSRMD